MSSFEIKVVAMNSFLTRVKKVHNIAPGETLWGVANKNNVPLSHLMELNPTLKGKERSLKIGDPVNVPFSPMDLAEQLKGKTSDEMISEVARAYQIDPAAFRQLLVAESGMNPNALNQGSQAAGIGQLMPEVAKMYGVSNVNDVAQNAAASAAHLGTYLTKARNIVPGGSEDLSLWHALMMYNWGIGNFMKWFKAGRKEQPPKETRFHPAKVFLALSKNPPPEYQPYYDEFLSVRV